uniref:Uncharacterized protein n=1 Tax=Neobodo designis TaxID=312471 RepID=A0A7S1QWD2_NEODS|mmetsp:Transcript_53665/g.165059  ORF Transcript_53665/g.165059 Transcript_53665/m.165059 type:complete len:187 (+) Transcript_53665:44-604(+)
MPNETTTSAAPVRPTTPAPPPTLVAPSDATSELSMRTAIILGSVVFVLFVVALACLLCRRRRQSAPRPQPADPQRPAADRSSRGPVVAFLIDGRATGVGEGDGSPSSAVHSMRCLQLQEDLLADDAAVVAPASVPSTPGTGGRERSGSIVPTGRAETPTVPTPRRSNSLGERPPAWAGRAPSARGK